MSEPSATESGEKFLHSISCGYEAALDAGVSAADYELPTAVADAWADVRLAYDAYADAVIEFEDALDDSGLSQVMPGGEL